MQSKLISKLTYSFIILLAVVISFGSLLAGYLGIVPSSIFSFYVADGWCKSSFEGIGAHCFGDYYYPVSTASLNNPWDGSPNPNPGLTQFIFRLFSNSLYSGRVGLFVYLMIILTITILPFFDLWKTKVVKPIQSTSILLLGITTTPVLIGFDRGSLAGVIFGLSYFLYKNLESGKLRTSKVLLLILVLFKPQMLVLNLMLLPKMKIREILKLAVLQILLLIFSFALYYKSFPANLLSYLHQVISYQSYVPWGAVFPTNLSLANDLGIPFRALGISDSVQIIQKLIPALLVLGLFIKMKRNYQKMSQLNIFSVLIFSIICLPGVTFSYYLQLLLLVFIFCARDFLNERSSNIKFLLNSKVQIILGFITAIFLFIPWPFPLHLLLGDITRGHGAYFLGINWIPGVFALHIWYLCLLFQKVQSESEN